MNVDPAKLLEIIGELEVTRRVYADRIMELESEQAEPDPPDEQKSEE